MARRKNSTGLVAGTMMLVGQSGLILVRHVQGPVRFVACWTCSRAVQVAQLSTTLVVAGAGEVRGTRCAVCSPVCAASAIPQTRTHQMIVAVNFILISKRGGTISPAGCYLTHPSPITH